MFKRKTSIFCLLIAVLMMVSASTAAMAASPYETRYNNTVMASSVASISDSGLLTVDNQFQGIRGKTTKGEITTYVEKKPLGLFWTRVDIGEPNSQCCKVSACSIPPFPKLRYSCYKKANNSPREI